VLALDRDWEITVENAPTPLNLAPEKRYPMTFAILGIPEDAKVTFRRAVKLPEHWKNSQLTLAFDAQHWFWGIAPAGRLTLNGKEPAGLRQPLVPCGSGSFALDVSVMATGGTLEIALTVDGKDLRDRYQQRGQTTPHGVTGLFYLRRAEKPRSTIPVAGPWAVAQAFGQTAPVEVGQTAKGLWFETRFATPACPPGGKIFIAADVPLKGLLINDKFLSLPDTLRKIDVTRLLNPAGRENTLYWTLRGWASNMYKFPDKRPLPPLRLELY